MALVGRTMVYADDALIPLVHLVRDLPLAAGEADVTGAAAASCAGVPQGRYPA